MYLFCLVTAVDHDVEVEEVVADFVLYDVQVDDKAVRLLVEVDQDVAPVAEHVDELEVLVPRRREEGEDAAALHLRARRDVRLRDVVCEVRVHAVDLARVDVVHAVLAAVAGEGDLVEGEGLDVVDICSESCEVKCHSELGLTSRKYCGLYYGVLAI